MIHDPTPKFRRAFSSSLEPLEARIAPATFTVTNLNDAGAGSLRQAVADANNAVGADDIAFQAGLTGSIILLTGELLITDSVVVTGPGASAITVEGGASSRVFHLDLPNLTGLEAASGSNGGGLDVTISGLTITKGAADVGAGILVSTGDLTLQNSVVTLNVATAQGGGLANTSTGAIDLDFVTISNNTAPSAGGIYQNNGSFTMDHSTVSGNRANAPFGGD